MTATVPQPSPRLVDGLPAGFRFGAATASYQIEGAAREDGRGESIWDRFSHKPGAVVNGDTGDVACDHYHRWAADLDLMVELGLESYRFSIAWPRVQPDGRGPLNPRGVAFYRRLVEGLLERGIEPVATLYHWDLPQARQEAGGWAIRDTAERFADYAGAMATELGDVVEGWITHNEPWVVAILGHAYGRKAPGIRDWPTALTVAHHLLLSHGLAVDALRAQVKAPVGITLNLNPMRPLGGSDTAATARMDAHQNRWFLDPVLRGSYPGELLEHYERTFGPLPQLNPEDMDVISRPIDFLGVNYYSPTTVRESAESPLQAEAVTPRGHTTAMGWAVDAGGLYDLLAPAAGRLRRPRDLDHRERRRLRRRATGRRRRRGPLARRVHLRPPRGTAARGRRRRRRPPLPRLVAAGQLRVGARLRQAVRDRARGLRHAGADPEAQRALVPRPHPRHAGRRSLMASIAFEDVSKVFPDGTKAVDGLDLEIADGEFTILVGPSGSGKSTALRMVAGLEDASGGEITIGSRVVNDVAPKDRDIAMVFQSYALYPHMSVASNMGFALKMQGQDKAAIAARVQRAAARLGISELLERRPKALSGGQRQRVALGRAIVRSPQAFLMDEPLSNLDAKLRVEMRAYIARLHQELGTTTLYVTHDQTEAMTMGDRVAVMRDGRLEQVDSPQRLYEQPANMFVAGFIGSPAMNLLRGRIDDDGIDLGGQRVRLPRRTMHRGDVVVGIRPEALEPANGHRGDDVIELPVVLSEMLGSDVLLHLRSQATSVLTGDMLDTEDDLAADEQRFVARVGPHFRPAAGEHVRLRLDMDRVHLFDPETQLVIRR